MAKATDIQSLIDRIVDKVFLWVIPHSITPNQMTVVRFILVPVVYWLLISGNFGPALIVFIIAASTDFIDGAMARTRNQITDIGKVIDPLADKMLILSVLLYFGFKYLIIDIFIIVIILEILAVLLSVFFNTTTGNKPIGANVFGKIKMIFQSFSVGFFILGIFIKSTFFTNLSNYLLAAALVFAIISAIVQVYRNIITVKTAKK